MQMEAIIQSMTREERENPSHPQCQQKKADRSRIGSAGLQDQSAGEAVRRYEKDDEELHGKRRSSRMNRMFRGM